MRACIIIHFGRPLYYKHLDSRYCLHTNDITSFGKPSPSCGHERASIINPRVRVGTTLQTFQPSNGLSILSRLRTFSQYPRRIHLRFITESNTFSTLAYLSSPTSGTVAAQKSKETSGLLKSLRTFLLVHISSHKPYLESTVKAQISLCGLPMVL
jgi:hypothetical protein